MNIHDFSEKIKTLKDKPMVGVLIKTLSVIAVMVLSFGLGRLSVIDQKSPKTDQVAIYLPDGSQYAFKGSKIAQNEPKVGNLGSIAIESVKPLSDQNSTSNGQFFGSKSGSTYYVPGCKSGNRVHPENRVYFSSASEAENAGYKRSSLCK